MCMFNKSFYKLFDLYHFSIHIENLIASFINISFTTSLMNYNSLEIKLLSHYNVCLYAVENDAFYFNSICQMIFKIQLWLKD